VRSLQLPVKRTYYRLSFAETRISSALLRRACLIVQSKVDPIPGPNRLLNGRNRLQIALLTRTTSHLSLKGKSHYDSLSENLYESAPDRSVQQRRRSPAARHLWQPRLSPAATWRAAVGSKGTGEESATSPMTPLGRRTYGTGRPSKRPPAYNHLSHRLWDKRGPQQSVSASVSSSFHVTGALHWRHWSD
jgi:hypothetical protein